MQHLRNFIRSSNPQLWADTIVSEKWLLWRATSHRVQKYKGIIIDAKNANEYVEQAIPILPYLREEDLSRLYNDTNESHEKKQSTYFASPPLLVDNLCRVLTMEKTVKSASVKEIIYEPNKYSIQDGFCAATRESYTDGKLHGNVDHSPFLFQCKALDYGRKHWPNTLYVQPPMDKKRYIFSDPARNASFGGGAESVFTLYTTFDRRYNDLINDHTKPQSDIQDDHIVTITYDPILADEISSGAGGYTSSPICIYDGSSLNACSCNVCQRTFNKDHFNMIGGYTVPNKLYEYLQQNEHNIRQLYCVPDTTSIVPDQQLLQKSRLIDSNTIRQQKIDQFMSRTDRLFAQLKDYKEEKANLQSINPDLASEFEKEMESLTDVIEDYKCVEQFMNEAKWALGLGLKSTFRECLEENESIDLDIFIKVLDEMIHSAIIIIEKYEKLQ